MIVDVKLTDIRKYTLDKHNRTDDTPYGGGIGMVLSPEPVFRAIEAVGFEGKKMIYMSPRGKVLDRHMIEALKAPNTINETVKMIFFIRISLPERKSL